MKGVLYLIIFYSGYCFSQDVINIQGSDCDMHGSSKPGSKTFYLNGLKNRYSFPDEKDFDTSIHIQDLIHSPDPNQFSVNKAINLSGYVFNVKPGGVETCNCRSKDPAFRDTHIELTPDVNLTDPQFRVIIEVTPRIREIMSKNNLDWSTAALKSTVKGKKVEISGWLFYDSEHEDASFANDPEDHIGRLNWRATCWEIHPVTNIKILDSAIDLVTWRPVKNYKIEKKDSEPGKINSNNKINSKQPDYAKSQGNSKRVIIFMGVLILLLIVIVSLIMLNRK